MPTLCYGLDLANWAAGWAGRHGSGYARRDLQLHFFLFFFVFASFWIHLLEQSYSNSHLNLAYQLLQTQVTQHPPKSANGLLFILPTSLSLSLELARKQVHASTCYSNLLLLFFFLKLTSKVTSHFNQAPPNHELWGVHLDRHAAHHIGIPSQSTVICGVVHWIARQWVWLRMCHVHSCCNLHPLKELKK